MVLTSQEHSWTPELSFLVDDLTVENSIVKVIEAAKIESQYTPVSSVTRQPVHTSIIER